MNRCIVIIHTFTIYAHKFLIIGIRVTRIGRTITKATLCKITYSVIHRHFAIHRRLWKLKSMCSFYTNKKSTPSILRNAIIRSVKYLNSYGIS